MEHYLLRQVVYDSRQRFGDDFSVATELRQIHMRSARDGINRKTTSIKPTNGQRGRELVVRATEREHQSSPTQRWPLPPPPERTTLTACPWWSDAQGCGGSPGGTGWRRAGGGCRSARAPTPECRRPGWSSCGPLRTSGQGADGPQPKNRRQRWPANGVWRHEE